MNQHTLNKEQLVALTKPSKSFNRHIIIATAGLFLFIAIYFTLTIWFGKLSLELFSSISNGGSSNKLVTFISGLCLAFLSLFMIKSLFLFGKRDKTKRYLITKETEPELFSFINSIADEAQAPRPHKVFLTTRVNASVSYDLSLLNLLFPSKKNLEIGIGLVNVLNKGEFKAILAHEFGHFAQKSMLLGRYVYSAQQIVARVVYKRDALDSFIRGISSIDLRVAWIGWILSILVWAVRALIQTLFNLVSIVEKALSREMEFHADLVSVSISGSDALVHSLDKLRAADEAYNASLAFLEEQIHEKKAVNDICTIQTNYINKMRWVLNDESFGRSPQLNLENLASHRIFSPNNVSTPEMWSTHPADYDREENAKKVYYYKEIDENDSWNLFKNEKKIREELTAELIATAGVETENLPDEEGVRLMNENDFSWSFLEPKYKGAYHSRYSYLSFDKAEDVYKEMYYNTSFKELYTDDFSEIIDQLQEIEKETKLLEIVNNEVFTLEKRTISHRGNPIKRADIPEIIENLQKEEIEIRIKLMERDSQIRSAHFNAALNLNASMANYHKEINSLIHYAEHSISDLNDVSQKFNNTLQIVLADGKVSSSELQELLSVGNDVHDRLLAVKSRRDKIKFNSYLKNKAGGKDYLDIIEEYTMPKPNENNIDSWINNVMGWIASSTNGLNKLRNISLEHLLDIEEEIEKAFKTNSKLEFKYSLMNAELGRYKTLLPGEERKIQYKLGMWDRFQVGDGVFPSLAKFAVSAILIFGAVYIGNSSQETNLYFFNGLSIPVNLTVNGDENIIMPNDFHREMSSYENKIILVQNMEGDTIEYFEKELDTKALNNIYNIANAGSFVEYRVYYGYDRESKVKNIGPKKWFTSNADYMFKSAPESLYTSKGGDSKLVLEGYGSEINPYYMIGLTEIKKEQRAIVMSHAKWDEEESMYMQHWLSMASNFDSTLTFLEKRLENNPLEMTSIRIKQNLLSGKQKEEYCEEIKNSKSKFTAEGDYEYLVTRCMEDGKEQNSEFLKWHKKYKNNIWLNYAAGYVLASKQDWKKSMKAFEYSLSENKQLASASLLDMERVNRVLAKNKLSASDNQKHMLEKSTNVQFYRQMELGNEDYIGYSLNKSYYLLSQGEYVSALNNAEKYEGLEQFRWFVAGSKNSPKNVLEEAISSDYSNTLTTTNIYIALGILLRENKDLQSVLPLFKDVLQNEKRFNLAKKLFNAIKDKNKTNINKALINMDDFNLKAKHELIVAIALGKKFIINPTFEEILLLDEKPNF